MTQAQADAHLCGVTLDEHEGRFIAQHMVPYAFMQPACRGKRVLEVGFGAGFGADMLAQTAAEVIGIDMAPGNIDRAYKTYPRPNLKFMRMDATALQFPDASFDVVISCQVIEHIPEPLLPKYVQEIARVLKPDGVFCVSTLNLEVAQKPGQPYQKLIYHEKEFTAPELEQLLRQSFPTVEMQGVGLSPMHRVMLRLKRWGLMCLGPPALNPIARYYDRMTPRHFRVTPRNVRRSLDLLALCRP